MNDEVKQHIKEDLEELAEAARGMLDTIAISLETLEQML